MIHILKQTLRRIASVLAVLLLLLLAVPPQSAHANGVVLKVGYSGHATMQRQEDGTYTGYAIDYLNEIAKYTGWKYEIIYDTWENNVEKVKTGELDLLTMVRHSEEREEYFLYSDLAMARDYTALYALQDSNIYYQDYEHISGKRVGVVSQVIHKELFEEHAQSLGLDYEIVQYVTDAQAKQALQDGEIDLYAASGYADHSGSKVVDRFGLTGSYLVTGLMNQELMAQLDAAVRQARMKKPTLENDLAEKYYGASTELYLTREEHAYLQTIDAIPVIGFGARQPMSYSLGGGRLGGIVQDYLDMVGEVSGLQFVHTESEPVSFDDLIERLETEGGVMLSIGQGLGETSNIYQSDALFESSLSYVRRKDNQADLNAGGVFAVNCEMAYLEAMLLAENPNYSVRYYKTSQECMEAVYSGEADMTIQNEYVIDYFLEKPKYKSELTQVSGGTYLESICLYASQEYQHLVSILNKTLDCISKEQQAHTLASSTLKHAYVYDAEDILYEYSNIIWVSTVLLVVIVVLVVMLYNRIVSYNAQKKEKDELQEQIQRDELTGIYNRAGFLKKVEELIAEHPEDLYVIRMNICHFKVVNELYGTEKGDQLLREMGQELIQISQEKQMVAARFTADHFYLCLDRTKFEAADFPDRYYIPWLGININTRYGIYPVEEQKGIPVNAMCDRANMAITANYLGTDHIHYYSDESRQKLLREREIENEMEQAVAERQFCIYIQPKYDIDSDTITGGEALVRWIHPKKGIVPPGEFIGLFERNGFILRLDYYVWEECCRFLVQCKKNGLPILPISINVSRIHFYGTELKSKLMELLEKYQLEPGDLELEITESVCSEEPELIFSTCEELRQAGFKIAMDDFGSGYSSLNMLKEMPLDIIKMDLRFLSGETNAEQMEKGRNILCTLIQLARTLQLQVVVEGLETVEQRDFIHQIGGCIAQGYYYSKPVDCQSYEEMIRRSAVPAGSPC